MAAYRRQVKFRRHRVPRRQSKYISKIKPNATVLFIVIFIIACIVFSVMLGNYLKKKAEENRPSVLDTATGTDTETSGTSSGVSSIGKSDGHLRSGCIDISDFSETEELTARLRNLFASGFDSVTLPISKDGALLYYSPAAVALSHMPADANLPSLTDIISLIKSVGAEYRIAPTVTAYYYLTAPETDDPVLTEASYLFDTAIISEAYSLGADEVLVSGFESDLHKDERRDALLLFVEKLESSAPDIKIGFAFAPEVYCTDTTAANLERIAAEIAFLAVDTSGLDWTYSVTEETVYMTDENGKTVETTETVVLSNIRGQLDEITAKAKGSISLYGLRFLLDGTNTYTLREATDVLYSKNALDYYVISSPEGAYSPILPETTETDPPKKSETTRPKPQETKPPETETEPPETETEPPETETEPPVTETEPPETETEPPVTETEPPETETEPPETETDPPETETDPPETETEPPEIETEPPETETTPEETSSSIE